MKIKNINNTKNEVEIFNNESRSKNVKNTSITGVINQISKTGISFIYRTIFLIILSKEYLGLNGLFTNILQIFSLADLGIGSIITYRMYEPIRNKNIDYVSALMNFYKQVYKIIFIIIWIVGIAFIPFLSKIVDVSSIPRDVNIYIIYILFLAEVATSYLFSYKQSLMNADQNASITSIFQMICTLLSNTIKIIVLILSENYTLTLLLGIATQLTLNFAYSQYITYKYKIVFSRNIKLSKSDTKSILKDTYACLCHKIGATVVGGTDSLVLTKYVGLGVVGMYSNYNMIVSSIQSILTSAIVNITSSIGNYTIESTEEENEKLYLNMQFIVLWISSFCSICFFVMLNPFITLWLDESFLFEEWVVLVICILFFQQTSSSITITFVNATGLFVKDKYRPLIEAILNLSISIVLVRKLGIGGVFIGTIISGLLTYYWRTIYLLYKYAFKKRPNELVKLYATWISIALCVGFIVWSICNSMPNNIFGFLLRLVICIVGCNGLFFIITYKVKYNKFCRSLILKKYGNKTNQLRVNID